jgi:hypothetical protein
MVLLKESDKGISLEKITELYFVFLLKNSRFRFGILSRQVYKQ